VLYYFGPLDLIKKFDFVNFTSFRIKADKNCLMTMTKIAKGYFSFSSNGSLLL